VAAAPAPFLSLKLTSSEWLAKALPRLVEAEAACATDGDALTHFDLRSDNICITGAGAKFIDWSAACLGNPDLDLGAWLPSLELEGGPAPEALLPGAPAVAAWISRWHGRSGPWRWKTHKLTASRRFLTQSLGSAFSPSSCPKRQHAPVTNAQKKSARRTRC